MKTVVINTKIADFHTVKFAAEQTSQRLSYREYRIYATTTRTCMPTVRPPVQKITQT